MPRTETITNQALAETIDNADHNQIRSTLQQICNALPEAKKIAMTVLLVHSKKDSGTKKLVSSYETCENCKKTYDVTENRGRVCMYHEGYKEVYDDDDFWADHDEDCHGRIDALKDDENFANGYRWSCCQGELDEDGCVVTRHEPMPNSSKKRKRN